MTAVVQQSSNRESVYFSDNARQHILRYLNTQEKVKGIRFSVKKTGCSGLSYVVDYVNDDINPTDLCFPFQDDYQVFIDHKGYPFLKGMNVDYVKQGLNYKFTFQNPNQTGQCGCGESFSVK